MRNSSRDNRDNKFSKRDSGRDNRGGRDNRRDSGSFQMHDAICADCKGNCKVPFMPSSGKPVFCSNCFEKRGNGKSGSSRSNYSRTNFPKRDSQPDVNFNKQFDSINKRLDKIMKALNLES